MVACPPANSAPVTDAFPEVDDFFIFWVCESINALFRVFFVFLFIHEITDLVWDLRKKRLNFLLDMWEVRVGTEISRMMPYNRQRQHNKRKAGSTDITTSWPRENRIRCGKRSTRSLCNAVGCLMIIRP